MKDLTLAICIYNAERYIVETLQSVCAQTMQNFHLLLLDDCSTDTSILKAEHYLQAQNRPYEIVTLPTNSGLCAGRRYVEEYTKTKYLLFVDADDCPHPTLVEKLYNTITADPDLMAVGCYLTYIDENSKPIKGGIFLGATTKKEFYAKAAAAKLIFMQPTAIYDRELALKVGGHNLIGFPEGKPRYQDLCEDLDLWCRMSDLYTENKAIIVLPEILCSYRKHASAMSTDSYNMLLRMRHIKTNLKRRRIGEKELSFVEFIQNLTSQEKRNLQREARAAQTVRKAGMALHHKHLFTALANLLTAFCIQPSYVWDKIKHNLIRQHD